MVEQNVKSALKVADNAIALESGQLVLPKKSSEFLLDPNIERLFLGGPALEQVNHEKSAACGV